MRLLIRLIERLVNLIAPKQCTICGKRLAIGEELICSVCNYHLPRTNFSKQPYDNKMAKMFWGQIPIERAAAWFFYEPHSNVSRVIHSLKYFNHPEKGVVMGKMLAAEIMSDNFFDSINCIIPVPLTKKRKRARGYNQSYEIARGISEITNIEILDGVVKRKSFKKSQTRMDRWQRMENVENAFELQDKKALAGKHILIVDDVVTTGATIISCAQAITKCIQGNRFNKVKFSVLSVGYAGS
ncbi:MAG: ComF family protein [Prevotella sp.]|nr:ComF family protein [Prevotella sp.]